MKKISAIEWLVNELQIFATKEEMDIIEQAKQMEKEQMWNYIKVNYVNGENSLAFHKEEFEQYYNEQYGKCSGIFKQKV